MAISGAILDTLIENQKDAISRHKLFSYAIASAGFLIILTVNFLAVPLENSKTLLENSKSLLSVGGGFISSISLFPIAQIIERRAKLRKYNMFKLNMHLMDEEESKRFEDDIWKSL